jgi:hypothetical protein
MTVSLARRLVGPDISFGPFRFVEAVPWLLLAETFRIVGANVGLLLAWLAFIPECVSLS